MKTTDLGSTYRVDCDFSDVMQFASRWPCYGPRNPVWFVFEKRTGDLVDMEGDSEDNDPSGVLALSEDAQRSGCTALSIDYPR